MQVIVSLLNLQSDELEDESARRLLEESRNRIKSMMLIHEKLYRSGDMARIDFESYVGNIVSELYSTFDIVIVKGKIGFEIVSSGEMLDLDRAVPCGLIINELTTNALKHAFVNAASGKIRTSFTKDGNGRYELTFSDNGAGLPEGFDIDRTSSLGLRLVKGLAERQLKGEMKIENDGGTRVTIRFS